MHSHKAKPDKINDKHGSSLPSINEYFGLLLYFSSKSPFAQLFSFAAEILDRGCNGICAEIRKRLSIWNRLRVFRGCFYTAILSQTLCGYAFKTHISSSPNRRDSFII